jgi:hypothetical protein
MAKKRFDCVELQHKGGDRIYETTKGMTHEQLLAWWEERNRRFQEGRAARRAGPKTEATATSGTDNQTRRG